MTLDQICVTKEWAEKLKKARYPQRDSAFCWYFNHEAEVVHLVHNSEDQNGVICAAPTASEILEKLPSREFNKNGYLTFCKGIADYRVYWTSQNSGIWIADFNDLLLPNALAKMYCYLVQENLIKKE